MTKKLFLLLTLSVLLFNACKKTKEEVKEEPIVPVVPIDTSAKEEVVQITTPYGDMFLWLYKATPLHRENFLKLAKDGFYDNTTFHRIIPNFMIQGGDPNSKDADPSNDGQGGPNYTIPAEIRDTILHDRGALAAARLGNNVNPQKASSGSQFYICHSKSGTAHLNGEYTVYGMVMKGLEVIDSIVKQPKDVNARPLSDIKMQVKVIIKTRNEIKSEYNYVPKQ